MITYVFEGNLYINITNRCPNRCEFCVRQLHDGVGDADSLWLKTEPTKEEILQDILARDLSAYRQLVFCGYGEPFERLDDMLWVLKGVKGHSPIPTRINTNGLGDLICGRKTAAELDGLVDILSVSLNAPDRDAYDALCHSDFGKQAFDSLIAFTKEAAAVVDEVYLSIIDTMPEADIERCRAIANECGATLKIRALIE